MIIPRRINKRAYALVALVLLLIGSLATVLNIQPANGAGGWWDPSWRYRKTITINHTMVPTDQTNFPVLIKLTDSDLAAKAQADGRDIAFTNSTLAKLDHEIEYYNSSTGSLVAWVRANLSSTVDTVLQMYYGNPNAPAQQNPTGVWDSNYVMVQHLADTGASSTPQPWSQYAGNPILSGSTDGFGSAFYDSDSGIYHFYCSWGSILHYTSPNGKTGWTADPLNPMLTGNNEGVPTVWKENGTWYMLYRYGGPDKVGLATSTDGSHWTRYAENPVIQVGQLDPWGLIKVGSTYYLWINDGFGGNGRGAELCTSTDLIHWTQDTNAIFSGGRYCVCPFKYGAYYYMLVPLYTTGPYGVIELYRCSSPTFYASQRQYLGIVVPTGTPGSWNQYRHDTPCVLTDTIYRDTYAASNNQLWMYYASTPDSGSSWWTGMCIEQNITDALTRFTPPASNIVKDSTSNQNNGIPSGGLTMNVSGIIDGADSFDGSTAYIDCGNNSTLKGMNALTVEIWIKPNAIGGSGAGVVAKWNTWTSGSYIMYWGGSGNLGWGVIPQTGSYAQISGGPAVALGQWQQLVGVYDGSQVRLYRNATLAGTPASLAGKVMSENSECYVGRYTTPFFNGIADEVRISNVSRSASWIATEYNNQGSPSTFYSVGTEENAPNNYTLTIAIVGQGSVNLNASGPYSYGDKVQLSAVPSPGWSFDHWSGDLSGSVNPSTILIDNNKTVTATFTQNTYTLSVNVVGSGVVNLNNSGPYHYGDVVQLTAVPFAGWSFAGWSGDASGSTNPTTVTMTGNKAVTASFTENTYTLTVTVSPVGSGIVNLDNYGPYHYGNIVHLAAVSAAGWSFDHWSGDLTGSTNPFALTITGNMAVTANFVLPQLCINPSSVQKGPGDTYTTFQTSVMVNKIMDLKGFDFNLTWDNNLIALTNVDFNTALDSVWGHGNWFLAYNVTGAGYYELAAVSTSTSFTSTTATPLVTLTFIVKAAVGQTSIHFALVKLSDSQANSIQTQVTDGTYQMTGPQYTPMLQTTPGSVTCRKYHDYFTVQINVTNAITVDGFSFTINYSPALMRYVSVSWGELGSGIITNVDQTNGILEGHVAGSAISGNRWLLNVTFQDLATMIWKKGQANELDGQVWFHYTSLSFSGVQQLVYQEGGLGQISVNSVAFKFVPIQGDITNDGVVDILDMRAVAAYFDVKQGDPLWSTASVLDLNGNGVIDIYDLVLIGANFS